MHEGTLFAASFDPYRLEMTGQPAPVLEGVRFLTRSGVAQFAISSNGTLVYLPGGSVGISYPQNTLVWVDRNEKEEALNAEPNAYTSPSLSADGTRVALIVRVDGPMSGIGDIWIWDVVRRNISRLTFEKSLTTSPLWTPDSRRIVYFSLRERTSAVYSRAADGTGKEEILGSVPETQALPYSWSADGKNLVLNLYKAGLDVDIGVMSMEGDRKYRTLLGEKYTEGQPQISPDGRWMAYISDDSGQIQVYVRPFPQVDSGRWQISQSGGDSPLWSRDGRELFYRSGDAVMGVSVKTGPAPIFSLPKNLFKGTYVSLPVSSDPHPWDISPDGRFLMMKPPASAAAPSEAAGPRKINIVLNWFEELKQRVPVK
jgi:Tol biopolymer transport system component